MVKGVGPIQEQNVVEEKFFASRVLARKAISPKDDGRQLKV